MLRRTSRQRDLDNQFVIDRSHSARYFDRRYLIDLQSANRSSMFVAIDRSEGYLSNPSFRSDEVRYSAKLIARKESFPNHSVNRWTIENEKIRFKSASDTCVLSHLVVILINHLKLIDRVSSIISKSLFTIQLVDFNHYYDKPHKPTQIFKSKSRALKAAIKIS